MPCSEKRARLLLTRGRARVHRVVPMVIRLVDREKAGSYTGRVAVRASGSFNIQCKDAVVQGVGHKHCKLIQRSDGYGYARIATNKGEAR